MVKEIQLTRGLVALVDDEDFEWLSEYKWCAIPRRYMEKNKHWYAVRGRSRKLISMHREIMDPPNGLVVAHMDNNGLNNCKSNLRVTTRRLNNANRINTGRTGTYRGVNLRMGMGRPTAQIGMNIN